MTYSLYFHIPFCTKKCDYCHFYVIPDQKRHQDLLMRSLEKHWEISQELIPKESPVSIYFGGGTPSLLPAESIEQILSWIPHKDAEITLEVNPENGSFEKMASFKKAGINRISIGAQTFDDYLLKQIGRTHLSQDIQTTVENASKAGIENISLDLMYDLPDQDLSSWEKSLEKALSLPLTHLSLYNLSIEPHTVFYKNRDKIQSRMPKEHESLNMLELAVKKCEEKGFHRYEISAFAKKGRHSIHNTGYWQDRPFLGFGPSAFSYWNGKRFRNISNLSLYAKALQNKTEPIDFQEQLPSEEKMKEKIAVGLRMLQGVLIEPWPKSITSALHELKEKNLIETETNCIRLTHRGLLFHDTVAEIIFSYG